MAPQQPNNNNSNNKKSTTSGTTSSSATICSQGTPMIVKRVYNIPMVNMAFGLTISQYDKLKSSNVTVGEIMNRAEGWAAYLWEKVTPIIEKLQDPISKVDQVACNTLNFVEDKFNVIKQQHTGKPDSRVLPEK